MEQQEEKMKKIDRIGEIKENNFGTKMKIIKYENWRNVIVEFQDEYKAKFWKLCHSSQTIQSL